MAEDVGDGGRVRRAVLGHFAGKGIEFDQHSRARSAPDKPRLLHARAQRAETHTRHLDLAPAFPRQRLWIPRDDRLGIAQRQIVDLDDVRSGEDHPVPDDVVRVHYVMVQRHVLPRGEIRCPPVRTRSVWVLIQGAFDRGGQGRTETVRFFRVSTLGVVFRIGIRVAGALTGRSEPGRLW